MTRSLQPHDLRGTIPGLATIHPGRAWATLLPLLSNAHIPDPDQIDIADVTVSLLYDSDHRHHRRPEQAVDHARQMAIALGLLDFREHPDGSIHTWSGWLYGEHWVVTAYTPRKQHSAGVAGYPVGTRHPQDPNEGGER